LIVFSFNPVLLAIMDLPWSAGDPAMNFCEPEDSISIPNSFNNLSSDKSESIKLSDISIKFTEMLFLNQGSKSF